MKRVFKLNWAIFLPLKRQLFFYLYFCCLFLIGSCFINYAHADDVTLSDVPLATLPSSGPANLMFVLDDSGSMDFEFMTPGNHGAWDGSEWNVYLFDNPGDNEYSRNDLHGMGACMLWKSQWHTYNKMYYNPNSDYVPWARVKALANSDPNFDDRSQSDASITNTRSHPMYDDWTLDLRDRFYDFGGNEIIVDDEDDGYERLGDQDDWYENQSSGDAIEGDYEEGEAYNGAEGARWTPDLPDSGEYDVYVNWPGESDNELEVNYIVHHKGTNSTIGPYSHDESSNGWEKLGTFEFNSGESGYVQLEVDSDTVDNGEEFAADAVKFVPTDSSAVDIPRAHYYVWSETDDCPYLVILDSDSSQIKYYKASGSSVDNSLDNNNDEINSLVHTASSDVPADVKTDRSYAQEMQNFANWYSFYRRRELTANAAIGNVIDSISDVQVGILTIHNRIEQGVLPVQLDGQDYSDTLLSLLYSHYSSGGTPLRNALEDVGQYYDDEDDESWEGLGNCPYVSAAEGGECQQSFAVAMTDGYWNGGMPYIGNADGSLPYSFQDDDDHYLYKDEYSETLADVAMMYYQNDLSSTLDNKVPTNPESVPTHHDPADWQHMVTYGVSFGVTGTLNPDDYDLNVNSTSPNYPVWPNPRDSENKERVDDLWHAAVNGRGKFLSAADPMELVNSLKEILSNIEDRVSSASSVSINGDELYKEMGNEVRLFQSSYSSASWTGDVRSFNIIQSTGEVNATAMWSAQDMLDNSQASWNSRLIATFNGTEGVPFAFDSLSLTQKSYLNNNSTLVNYLHGDTSEDGDAFRNRASLLGDIVHSSPVFHEGIIYAGANDGMLHAFNATNGEEVFAYVPKLVFDHLADYASLDYTHKYYVDLTPVVKRAKYILDADDGYESLLVGGLRKGGKGYYALDVTNASSFASVSDLADNVLWEYTNADHLGYTFSSPAIVRSNNSGNKWVVLFGNGYNSAEGRAELFILNPDGTLIKRIDTGYGYQNGTIKNGLSSPTPIDVDNDEKVDYVYAGDLKGNMWKFDLTSSNVDDWGVAFEASNGTAMPLFRAKNDNGVAQPITTKPDVMRHCRRHGYMVEFGTGKHFSQADNSDTTQQSVYGIWDYGDDADDQEYLGSFNRNATSVLSNQPSSVSLLKQQVNATINVNDRSIRITSNNAASWTTTVDSDSGQFGDLSGHAGWYMDLPDSGERVISPVIIRDGKLIFISHVPSGEPCSCGGYSYVHEIDACDGSRLSSPAFDIDEDGTIDANDKVSYNGETYVPSGMSFEGKLQSPAILKKKDSDTEIKYFSSSTGEIVTMTEKAAKVGVTYWKEMFK